MNLRHPLVISLAISLFMLVLFFLLSWMTNWNILAIIGIGLAAFSSIVIFVKLMMDLSKEQKNTFEASDNEADTTENENNHD